MKRLAILLALLTVAATPPAPPGFTPTLKSPKDASSVPSVTPQVVILPKVPIYTLAFTNDVLSTNLLMATVQKSSSPRGPWVTFATMRFTNYFLFDITNAPGSAFFRLVSP